MREGTTTMKGQAGTNPGAHEATRAVRVDEPRPRGCDRMALVARITAWLEYTAGLYTDADDPDTEVVELVTHAEIAHAMRLGPPEATWLQVALAIAATRLVPAPAGGDGVSVVVPADLAVYEVETAVGSARTRIEVTAQCEAAAIAAATNAAASQMRDQTRATRTGTWGEGEPREE